MLEARAFEPDFLRRLDRLVLGVKRSRTVRTRGVCACDCVVRRYGADGLLTKMRVVAVCIASDWRL